MGYVKVRIPSELIEPRPIYSLKLENTFFTPKELDSFLRDLEGDLDSVSKIIRDGDYSIISYYVDILSQGREMGGVCSGGFVLTVGQRESKHALASFQEHYKKSFVIARTKILGADIPLDIYANVIGARDHLSEEEDAFFPDF